MNVKMASLVALSVAAAGSLFTGCATVTRGTSEVLVVETEPAGASVRLSNGMVGTSPTSFKIPRKGAVTVTIFKEGYEPLEVQVHTQVAGSGAAGMAGNVLVGGLVGVGIDSFSGGMLEHKPNPVKVTLVARASASTPPQASIRARAERSPALPATVPSDARGLPPGGSDNAQDFSAIVAEEASEAPLTDGKSAPPTGPIAFGSPAGTTSASSAP